MTLIDVLVSTVMLFVLIIFFLTSFSYVAKGQGEARKLTIAANLAATIMEEAKAKPWSFFQTTGNKTAYFTSLSDEDQRYLLRVEVLPAPEAGLRALRVTITYAQKEFVLTSYVSQYSSSLNDDLPS